MASLSLFVFFLLSYLLLLLSAQQVETYSSQNCRTSLRCGDLESLDKIGFPFANTPPPNCGVGIVSCNNDTERIQLAVTEERRYEVINISWIPDHPKWPNAYVLGIRDQMLSENLINGRCKSITNSSTIYIQQSPSISFEIISPNRTFVRCDRPVHDLGPMESSDIECRDNYKVYDRDPSDSSPIPSACKMIQVPIKPGSSGSKPYVSGEFELLVHVPDECSARHEREGQCLHHLEGKVICAKEGKSKVLVIALGT